MQLLQPKRVLLGVTGGIAAYKACELCRRLRDLGAEVQVVMTPAGTRFVTPLTLQALSGRPVRTDLLDPSAEAAMGHIELAKWADLILVAPASADFLARLAAGLADDLLTTACLASDAPMAVAPAMNQAMWRSPATRRNVATLIADGVQIWGPGSGSQACGDEGPGRMLEPAELLDHLQTALNLTAAGPASAGRHLAGRHVVITAGPTREPLDPVRYLSNHSSGKQGFALAAAAAEAGARVSLIAGPVDLPTPKDVQRVDVLTACDMLAAAERCCRDGADVFISVAAVADYRPATPAEQKIKKAAGATGLTLTLVENPDIVATIATGTPRPFTVAFAAETENLVAHARTKLLRKKVDMVVANDVSRSDIGFGSDDNGVTLVTADGDEELKAMPKTALARLLIERIAQSAGFGCTPERASSGNGGDSH
ncbi:MAG: bifunctional phosphopantothenoylcysteine decarboxylase/phosphopantothenate--cysteine ligase CoaBC [Gammaproteobacteria bacterium]|nr:bifunctional phosphopantothenoylcysteine decarboxylase/phosphopantothenate--cysteine ligase CoaBC [Gammaproteobacteria bacterium]